MDPQRTPALTRRARTEPEELRSPALRAAAAADGARKKVRKKLLWMAVEKGMSIDASITECEYLLHFSNDKNQHINKSETELDARGDVCEELCVR